MTNTTTTTAGKQDGRSIRHLPAAQLVQRCRRAGYTQWEIARLAGVSQGTVTNTIGRRRKGSVSSERVWAVLERILA